MAKKKSKSDMQHEIVTAIKAYRSEADDSVRERMMKDKENWDCFHLRQDYSKKLKGQSQEFLPKVAMAVEQSANFLQQGLLDTNEWFKVEPEPGMIEEMMLLKPSEVRKLLLRGLRQAEFHASMNDGIKTGLIASLMIHKVHGKKVPKVTYKAKETINKSSGKFESKLLKKTDYKWILQVSTVDPNNYRVDPTGRGLYELEDTYMDYYELLKLAQEDDSPYDLEVIKNMSASRKDSTSDHKMDTARVQGLMPSSSQIRRTVKVTEMWGNILDSEGMLIHENIVCAIADDTWLIRPPERNPMWHGESPYVATPIITVPFSKQGKALMDAPVSLNRAQNEMFNLMLDGGLMAVHGIKQIRKNWLDDESQVEEGIPAGTTLAVNNACPPGATVLERIDTATIPTDGINIFNILSQEQNVASMTNDLRMGVASFRQVKATEVVEASQTISSMFSGLASQIEVNHIEKILHRAWKTMLQHSEDMDTAEVKALIGARRADELAKMSKQRLFADCVQGTVFKVFGISATLNKQKDFTKLQAMLQTVVTNPALQEEFSRKYSFTKLLTEIMRSLDLNPDKIEADQTEGGDLTGAPADVAGGGMNMPNEQSQIPQAGAAGNQGDLSAMGTATSMVPQTEFPASRATPQG